MANLILKFCRSHRKSLKIKQTLFFLNKLGRMLKFSRNLPGLTKVLPIMKQISSNVFKCRKFQQKEYCYEEFFCFFTSFSLIPPEAEPYKIVFR